MNSDPPFAAKTVAPHDDRLAVHRLWIAAVELLAIIGVGLVVALNCSWFVFAACSLIGFPLSWLFALQVVGATPPPALIDLDVPVLLRSILTPAIVALRRGLQEPSSDSLHDQRVPPETRHIVHVAPADTIATRP